MGFYQDRILPRLIHLLMQQRRLAPYRGHVVPQATGRVLEIGIGSGLNLPFYGGSVAQIIGLEPSSKLLDMTRDAARHISSSLQLIKGNAEALPVENRSIDTIVTTWTMCSIAHVEAALAEMRRVLRPGGRLLFVEHGRAPEPRVRWWQDRIAPAWQLLSGGCHPNRPMDDLIEQSGLRIERLETGYMRGPKPMAFMYEGSARPA